MERTRRGGCLRLFHKQIVCPMLTAMEHGKMSLADFHVSVDLQLQKTVSNLATENKLELKYW